MTTDNHCYSILVVEDDDDIRMIVREVLTDAGYEVFTAADGIEAMSTVRSATGICAILLDMRMPNMDGWEFAKQYRTTAKPLAHIIVMTAASDAVARAAQVNADGVLAKPFDLNKLLEVVRSFC